MDQVDWNGEDQQTSLNFLHYLWYFFLAGLAYFAAFISCETFHAIYWPVKRTLLTRVYGIVIFTVWILALLISATWTTSNLLLSYKHTMFNWGPYTLIPVLITCGCNLGIWKKFQRGTVASAQQQTRDLQKKRLTDTLSSVSGLTLLAWFPLVLLNFLISLRRLPVPWKFYFMINVFDYSNSFVNLVVYALLRITELQTLTSCCFGRQPATNTMLTENRNERERTNDICHELTLDQQDVMNIKLLIALVKSNAFFLLSFPHFWHILEHLLDTHAFHWRALINQSVFMPGYNNFLWWIAVTKKTKYLLKDKVQRDF